MSWVSVCRQLTSRAMALYLRHWTRVSKNFPFKTNFEVHNMTTMTMVMRCRDKVMHAWVVVCFSKSRMAFKSKHSSVTVYLSITFFSVVAL